VILWVTVDAPTAAAVVEGGRNGVVRAGAGARATIPTGLAAVTAQALSGKVTPGSRTMRRPSLGRGGTVR